MQLWGLHEHLFLPMALVLPKSNALLLSSGIRIDQQLARRTHHPPSPLFLISTRSTQLISSAYM